MNLTNIGDLLPAYSMCRAEAVEQDESEEQQWQHEVQLVEDQRALQQSRNGNSHGTDDESQKPGRDTSQGDGIDENANTSSPLPEPPSPLSVRTGGDGDCIHRRSSGPDQQPPSPLHVQLQMFAEEEASAPKNIEVEDVPQEEASASKHIETAVKTETVHQGASFKMVSSHS